ncbi:MAG TPA: CBS domain-containing protein [Xanthobacteraceae bacterium]|nr:CBS domain-containing protein [Xanthobacteraceae bacterium]
MDKRIKTAKQMIDAKKRPGVISIAPDSTVLAALKLLAEHDIGALVVIEQERLVGILSERDCARKVELQGRTAANTRVRDIMTAKVLTVRPEQSAEDCRKIMGTARIRHLPVVEDGRAIGVLSSKDILDEVIAEDERLIRRLETERLMTSAGQY